MTSSITTLGVPSAEPSQRGSRGQSPLCHVRRVTLGAFLSQNLRHPTCEAGGAAHPPRGCSGRCYSRVGPRAVGAERQAPGQLFLPAPLSAPKWIPRNSTPSKKVASTCELVFARRAASGGLREQERPQDGRLSDPRPQGPHCNAGSVQVLASPGPCFPGLGSPGVGHTAPWPFSPPPGQACCCEEPDFCNLLKARAQKNWCFWTVVLKKTWESLGLQGDPTSPS